MGYIYGYIDYPGETFSWSGGVYYCPSPCYVRLTLYSDQQYDVNIDWGDGNTTNATSYTYNTYIYHTYEVQNPRIPEKYTVTVRTNTSTAQFSFNITLNLRVYGHWTTHYDYLAMGMTPTDPTNIRVGNTREFTATIDDSGPICFWENEESYTWKWYVSRNGGNYQTLQTAISNGWVEAYNTQYQIDKATVNLLFKEPGTYKIQARARGYRVTSLSTHNPSWYTIESTTETNSFTVLAQPTPSIQLESYHDAHGNQSLNGKAPFTATFKDTSMTTEPNQPAIVSRVWSFGDPESGFLNASTLQQQAHYFSGYGPYTVMLTITNNKGESASATHIFAPNLPRRVTVDTNPTPLSGTAPLLVTCSVETAGSPEPVTTWTYTLNNDPGYYSGSKEGDFAELSLLAPGTYTITRTVSQEGQTALTKNWTATVSAPTPTAEHPQTIPEFMLWIYNAAGTQRTAQLDMATDIRIQWNFMTGKVLTFRVPAIYDGIQSLRVGTKLAVGFAGKARPFIIASRTDQQNSEYVEFECIDYAEAIMESRIALVATRSTSGNGYDIQTCSGEALMRYFAVANLNSGRTDSLFKVLGTNSDMDGTTVTYSARYETIDEIMSDICTACGLGWDVIINDGTQYIVGWKPVKGTDRTVNTTAGVTPVILAARLQTATISEFRESLSKTIAVGAGQGAGAARTYTPYNISGTASPAVTGIDRREVFVDAGDAADAVEVKRMAVQELKNGQQETLYVIPEETSPYRFGTDYFVGDFVTVEDPHIGRLNMRVLSADYSTSDNGTKLQLKCGTDQTNYSKLITAQTRKNSYARK